MKKFAAWFDIPVSDMVRAIAFYEHLTSQKLKRLPVGENRETARQARGTSIHLAGQGLAPVMTTTLPATLLVSLFMVVSASSYRPQSQDVQLV